MLSEPASSNYSACENVKHLISVSLYLGVNQSLFSHLQLVQNLQLDA